MVAFLSFSLSIDLSPLLGRSTSRWRPSLSNSYLTVRSILVGTVHAKTQKNDRSGEEM